MAEQNGYFTVAGLFLFLVFIGGSNGVPAKPGNLTITSQIPSADHGIIAALTWTMPSNNKNYYYYVRYHLSNKKRHIQKRTKSNSARIFLKPNSAYVVKVMAFDSKNPSVQGKWSDDLKVQTGNSVPTQAPVNVTATAISTTSIFVRWGPIPQEYRNGKLLGYVVFYGQNNKRWKTKKLEHPLKFQCHLSNLPIGLDYHIAVAGYTEIGVGKKSDAVDVRRTRPATASTSRPAIASTARSATASTQRITTRPSTREDTAATTPKHVTNYIPKPTGDNKMATHEISSQPRQMDGISPTTVVSSGSPNAQANKDVHENKSSSGFVYKFIIPGAIGGLVMVLLIICIMWRQRRIKRKRNQGDEAIRLTPVSEEPKKKERSKFAVTRGEGSIRYAPPPKAYTASGPPPPPPPPPPDATPGTARLGGENREKLSVISESSEPSAPQAEPSKAKRPYAEVSIVPNDKDDRYVKRNEHKPVPSSPSKSTTSEAGYENMQHLYECLDRVKNAKGSPLYMNVGTTAQSEEEGLYEEIPADKKDNEPAVRQPLLEKNANEQVKAEYV